MVLTVRELLVSTMDDVKLTLDRIAKEDLGIERLNTQNSDNLDFHELAVWQIRTALLKAFMAGQESMINNKRRLNEIS